LLALLAPALFAQVAVVNGTYSNINSAARQYRVYYPAGTAVSAKLPVVVFIHGGGWYEGGLSDGTITPSACNNTDTIACRLAENGYVVYSIDYTLVSSFGGADLVITGTNTVSSNSTPFTAADVGSALLVLQTNGAGWNIGGYTVESAANGIGTLNGSPGTVGLTKGRFSKVSGATLWPVQWQDCNCFLQYMAGTLGVSVPGDPQNIFLFGHSAGAHLAGILGLAGNSAFATNCDQPSSNFTIRGIVAASPPTDLVTLYTETATAQSDIRNLLGCIPGYGDCNQVAMSASITNYVGENLPPYLSLSGIDDTTIPPENVQEASIDFANLSPPVTSQWVELSPSFYHDLDLYYFTPCSSDPTVGAEPSPCGSEGTAFTKALAFITSLQLYPGGLTIEAGNNQSIAEGTTAATALEVSVADQHGDALAGVTVTFTSGAGGSFSGASSAMVVTNSSGIATAPSLTVNSTPGPLTVTASSGGVSATFSLTITQQTTPASLAIVSGNNQSITEGGTGATPLAVSVTNQYGQTLAGVTVTFTSGAGGSFSGSSSAAVATNSSGIATAPALMVNSTPGPLSVIASTSSLNATFSLTITQQTAPASLAIVSGNNQSITEGGTAGTPLAVLVTNQYGQTLSGVTVTFTSGAGASFSGASSATVVSNSSGIATASPLTVNSTPGPLTVTASSSGVSATFSLTITQQTTPASLAIVSGNNQSITEGGTAGTPLAVLVTNQYGQTLSGVTVTFTSGAGASFSGANSAAAVTGATGVATAPALTANSNLGPLSVTASASGLSTTFSLTVVELTSAASLTIVSGNNQVITEGGTASTPLAVSVTNLYGQGLAGVSVTFTSATGGSFNGASSAAAVSDSTGLATAPALTVTSSPGPLSVTAGAANLKATFSLSIGQQTTPSALSITSGNYQSIAAGGTNATPLAVSVTNQYGQTVAGVGVTFTVNAGAGHQSGSFNGYGSFEVTSNSIGLATAPALTANSSPGPFMVTASTGAVSTTFWLNIGPLAAPFGYVDTPANNTTGVAGGLGVTGWALSPVGVRTIAIWRDPVAGEGTNWIYVGTAVVIAGSRPDVAEAFPGYPCGNCGWGAQILTNELPNTTGAAGVGNGTYTLHIIATDNIGQTAVIGSTVFTAANAESVLPFGTIDTPAQGQTVSGSSYVNFGWVLTPQPNLIPLNGSTIMVYVDNVAVGHPVYNNYRVDIATIFPGLQNSMGAVGYLYIDTTKLTNGLHSIYWTATDNAGHAGGIGSRFFNVQN
jgi:acetyl esterase/lipase